LRGRVDPERRKSAREPVRQRADAAEDCQCENDREHGPRKLEIGPDGKEKGRPKPPRL
jgi:hypothetical protein